MGKQYDILTGLNYPPNGVGDEVRREPGDVADDLPPKSVEWLLEAGHIRQHVEQKAAPAVSSKSQPVEQDTAPAEVSNDASDLD